MSELLERPQWAAAGVYRLYAHDDRLLYIGVGSSPEQRWAVHAKTADWWGDVARREVQWFRVYAAAQRSEIQAIWDENPIHNTVRIDPSGLPEVPDEATGAEIAVVYFSHNMTEVLNRVRLLGEDYTVSSRGKPVASVIPVEVAQLVRRVGGADRAAEILRAHLGPEPGDDEA